MKEVMLDETGKEWNKNLVGIKTALETIAEQEKSAADSAKEAVQAVQNVTNFSEGMRIENGMMCMVFSVPDDNAE